MSLLAAFTLGAIAGGVVFLIGFVLGVLVLSRGPDLVEPLLADDDPDQSWPGFFWRDTDPRTTSTEGTS